MEDGYLDLNMGLDRIL